MLKARRTYPTNFHEHVTNKIVLVLRIFNQKFDGERINFLSWIGNVFQAKFLVSEQTT